MEKQHSVKHVVLLSLSHTCFRLSLEPQHIVLRDHVRLLIGYRSAIESVNTGSMDPFIS